MTVVVDEYNDIDQVEWVFERVVRVIQHHQLQRLTRKPDEIKAVVEWRSYLQVEDTLCSKGQRLQWGI